MSYENKNWRRMLVMFAGNIIHSNHEYKINDSIWQKVNIFAVLFWCCNQ